MIGQLPKLNEIAPNIDTDDRHSINTCTKSFTRALRDVADPLFSKTTLPNISNVYIDIYTTICHNICLNQTSISVSGLF